jgi:hypothetical protein
MKKKSWVLTFTGTVLLAILLTGCAKGTSASTTPMQVPASTTPAIQSTSQAASSLLKTNLPLKISEPLDAAEIRNDTVTVKGQTAPRAMVSVDDKAGVADANGNFSVTINLDPGPNAIDVIATDDSGKEGEAIIMVNMMSSGTPEATVITGQPGSYQGTIPLNVTQPTDAATIATDTVAVKGQTAPGAIVMVNDEIDVADDSGNFSITISLVPGPNAIDVIVQNEDGNENEIILMVNY